MWWSDVAGATLGLEGRRNGEILRRWRVSLDVALASNPRLALAPVKRNAYAGCEDASHCRRYTASVKMVLWKCAAMHVSSCGGVHCGVVQGGLDCVYLGCVSTRACLLYAVTQVQYIGVCMAHVVSYLLQRHCNVPGCVSGLAELAPEIHASHKYQSIRASAASANYHTPSYRQALNNIFIFGTHPRRIPTCRDHHINT